jgi:hypothetical protein
MAQLTQTNNFAGDVIPIIYEVLGTSFESKEMQLLRSEFGIASSRFVPNMRAAANPIGAYVEGSPGSETATVTYAERELAIKEMMVYVEFIPSNWSEIWESFRSVDNYTNLALNPTVMRSVMNVLKNEIGEQLEDLTWQGDTAGAAAISYYDCFIKLAAADANVVDVTNIGVITETNVFDVLADVYQAIPSQLLKRKSLKIAMSTTDWRKMQVANLDAKSTTDGYLDDGTKQTYLGIPIVHTSGIPENTIFTTLMSPSLTDGNLIFGAWVDPEQEANSARIMRVANNSDTWFIRINMKAGVQYAEGTEIVLYQGS